MCVFLCSPSFRSGLDIWFEQREEALALVTAATSAGIFNDLGSGSNVDACVITASGTEELRNFVKPNERVEKERKCVCFFPAIFYLLLSFPSPSI